MIPTFRIPYLETSAINHLKEDAYSELRIRILNTDGESAAIGVLAIAEVIATSSDDDRAELLAWCRRLARVTRFLESPGVVIENVLRVPSGRMRPSEVWHGASLSLVRTRLRWAPTATNPMQQFAYEFLRDKKDAFERVVSNIMYKVGDQARGTESPESWLGKLFENGEHLRGMLLAHKAPEAYVDQVEAGVRESSEPYLPLRAAIISEWLAVFVRCLRTERYGKRWAEGVDMIQGVYLAGVPVFVTDDEGQRDLMQLVSEFLPHRPRVIGLSELAASL